MISAISSSGSFSEIFGEDALKEFFDFDFEGDNDGEVSPGASRVSHDSSILFTAQGRNKPISERTDARRVVGKKLYSASDESVGSLIGMKRKPAPTRGRRLRKDNLPLYVFPSYDKCDALVFFPHAFSRNLNSGDFITLEKLFNTHLDRNCDIKFACYQDKPTTKNFARLFEFLNDMHPDTFMCVYNTIVVENQIQASIYLKFTDCRAIIRSLERSVTDPFLRGILDMCSDDRIKETILADKGFTGDVQDLVSMITSDLDTEVYLTAQLHMTFDDHTRKVTTLRLDSSVTSIKPLSQSYSVANCM